MNEQIAIVALFAAVVVAGVAEFLVHRRNLLSIPVRIHVNGTRGKSSVTRLIAAGLRAGGLRAFAKTTGTLPRMITSDGMEYPVYRMAKPNIIEQRRIVSFAAANEAQALVIECMALQPYLQSLCESKLVRATHAVITNAREDHLDVMGPTEEDVARALLGMVPSGQVLFTAERDYRPLFAETCRDRDCRMEIVEPDEERAVTDEELAAFGYVEHRENVALALRVCRDLGVPRAVALAGMQAVQPDIGVTRDLRINFFGREIFFVNCFAANDPESTERLWNMALENHPVVERRIMIINCRIDRPDRSRQLGEAIAAWRRADRYVLIGTGTYFLIRQAVRSGLEPGLFVNAGDRGGESIFEEILNHCRQSTLAVGIGNIAGPGMELMRYFYNRADLG